MEPASWVAKRRCAEGKEASEVERKEGERTCRAVQYFERDAPREAGNAQLRPGTPGVIVFAY